MNYQCKLCKGQFSLECIPLMLIKCGHTFCKNCVKKSFDYYNGFKCIQCSVFSDDSRNFVYNKILIENAPVKQFPNKFFSSDRLHSNSMYLNSDNSPHDQDYLASANRFSSNGMFLNQNTHPKQSSKNFLSHFVTKSKILEEKRNDMERNPRAFKKPGTPIINPNFGYSSPKSNIHTCLKIFRVNIKK